MPNRKTSPASLVWTTALLAALLSSACGRSEYGTRRDEVGAEDARIEEPFDAGDGAVMARDAQVDGGRRDAATDAGRDGGGHDASRDAGRDAGRLDATVPDAGRRDAMVSDTGIFDAGDRCAIIDCSPLDGPCEFGECNPATGGCFASPLPNGTECSDGDTCNGTDSCQSGACEPAFTESGDSCNDPRLLDGQTAGQSTWTGDLSCSVHDFSGSCSPASAPDMGYALQLTSTRRLVFEALSATSGQSAPSLVLQSGCDSTGGEVACTPSSRTTARLEETLAPGDYTLWVERGEAQANAYTLRMDVDPQDTCRAPTVISVPRPGETVDVQGSTAGSQDDFRGACVTATGGTDHVFKMEVARRTRLQITTVITGLQDFDTVLHVWAGACPTTGRQLECDDDGAGDQRSRVEMDFDPGTYTIVVDGFDSNQAGDYTLRVTGIVDPNVVSFPSAGDTRSQASGNSFQTDGDFVEGVRTFSAASATRLDIDLVVANALTCDSHETQVLLNGFIIGAFSVTPGLNRVSESFTFSRLVGPIYTLRYETARSVTPGCGSIRYSETESTVNVGN